MKTILVVDDETTFRLFVRQCLETIGYCVFEARNGSEGITVYEEYKPDLIITDIFMPVKGGLSLIRELRSQDARVKIIAMSGGSMVMTGDFLKYARDFGVAATLHKPFSAEKLAETVENLLSGDRI
jgi:two-component system, chemotaxis family, chemotaxis protein CheY